MSDVINDIQLHIDPKQYLNSIRQLDARITTGLRILATLESDIERITPLYGDKARVQGGELVDISEVIAKLVDLKRKITVDIDTYVDRKLRAVTAINRLECEQQQTVLSERYIVGKTWEQIATALSYDVRHVHRIHGEALLRIKEIIY